MRNDFVRTASCFTIFHVNVRSIRRHWDEFCAHVTVIRDLADVFVLTEINIPEELTSKFSLHDYHEHFFTRKDKVGGGIAVFIKNDWISSVVDIGLTNAESLAIRICNQSFAVTLLAIYRPPHLNAKHFVEELRMLPFPRGHICMIGDINIDLIKNQKPVVVEYLNTLADAGIEAMISCPTRVEYLGASLVSSCLDHVNVRAENDDVIPFVVEHKLSDHFFVGCRFISRSLQSVHHSRAGSEIEIVDNQKLDLLLKEYDWETFLSEVPECSAYDSFVTIYGEMVNSCKKTVLLKQRKTDCPWMNRSILSAIAEKEMAWVLCRRSPNNDKLRVAYKIARNRVTALIRLEKRQHFHRRFSESRSNPGKTWSVINQLRGRQSKNTHEAIARNFGAPSITLADQFNSQFASAASNSSPVGFFPSKVSPVVNSAFLPECTEEDIRYILFSIIGSDGNALVWMVLRLMSSAGTSIP